MLGSFNIYGEKIGAGLIAGLVSYFVHNLVPLIVCALIFEVIDFGTGLWKSAVVSHRKGENFVFESVKAWRTIYKVVFILLGIVLMEMLDAVLGPHDLRLANYFTAFCCGVEFWSFLENAAVISNHPVFRWLRKFMKTKVEDEIDFNKITKEEDNDKKANN